VLYGSVYQTVVRGGSPGGPQAVSEGKSLQKLYQTQRMKNTSIRFSAKTAFIG
jgi:hypothetical protein